MGLAPMVGPCIYRIHRVTVDVNESGPLDPGNRVRLLSPTTTLVAFLSQIFNTVAFRQIEDKIMPRCTHKGCGKEFDVANDTEDVCVYHPGAPVGVLYRHLFF